MTSLSWFGQKKIRELTKSCNLDGRVGPGQSPRLRIPNADQGIGLERDDQLVSGDFRSRYEHISRYSRVCEERWSSIADIGCGTGYGTQLLSEMGQVVGLDVSENAIGYAKATYSSGEYILGDASAAPFKDASFDAVTAFEVIEHLPEPEKLLEECHRILKRGGTLFLSSPNPAHIGNILRKVLLRIPIPPKVDMDNKYHLREFSYPESLSLISSHGFELEWSEGQTLPLDCFLPRSRPIISRVLKVRGLNDVLDWLLSEMGRNFPRLSWTVVYALRRR